MDKVLMYKKKIMEALKEGKPIVTHRGDDLDNRSCLHILKKIAIQEGFIKQDGELNIIRVPAGKFVEGAINVDTGGHVGCSLDNNTIIIDSGNDEVFNNAQSATENLSKIFTEIEIPTGFLKMIDQGNNRISPLRYYCPIRYLRKIPIEKIWNLASENKLEKDLSKQELEELGILEYVETQKKQMEEAIELIEKYTYNLADGKKIVISPEKIRAGTDLIYGEFGIDYFVSIDIMSRSEEIPSNIKSLLIEKKPEVYQRAVKPILEDKGTTFYIGANQAKGNLLPEKIKGFAKKLISENKTQEGYSGVYYDNSRQFVKCGGGAKSDFMLSYKSDEDFFAPNKILDEIIQGFEIEGKDNKGLEIAKKELIPILEQGIELPGHTIYFQRNFLNSLNEDIIQILLNLKGEEKKIDELLNKTKKVKDSSVEKQFMS